MEGKILRAALEGFLGRIVLKPKDDALVAVVQGDLAALLPVETKTTNNRGAGGTDFAIADTGLRDRSRRSSLKDKASSRVREGLDQKLAELGIEVPAVTV